MFRKPNLNRRAGAEEKLYSPQAKFDVRPRRQLREHKTGAVPEWAAGESVSADDYAASLRRKPRSLFGAIFLAALGFFLLAAGYGFWKLGPGLPGVEQGTEDIRLSVVGPSSASGGEVYAFDVVIQNLSPIGVRLADLVVEMPAGTRDAETLRDDLPRLRIPIGDIAPGETRRQAVAVGLFGDEGERREFKIALEYRSPNSATIFEKERYYEVALSAAPVRLTVDALSEITPGQPLALVAKVSSNATAPLGPIGLSVELPFGFAVDEMSEAPREPNLWVFETLAPGQTREVTITGRLDGAHGDLRVFRFSAGALESATSTEVAVPYGTRAVEVAVSRPFLDLILALDGAVAPEVVQWSQDQIAARLALVNNTTGPILDAEVSMTMAGIALDERSVEVSNGVYRSADNVVHWDKTTNADLAEIPPGDTVWLGFGFQSEPLAGGTAVFANPEITIDAEANGRRVFDENVPEQLVANLFKRIKLLTVVDVAPSIAYRTGANPPKVDAATGYRLTWVLQNTSSDISSGSASAVLSPLVEWVGNVSSEDVSYDPASRRVTWRVGNVAGGAGYGKPDRRASFDVTLVPSITYEGNSVPIHGVVTFVGNDTFAGAEVNVQSDALSTSDLAENNGKVVP